MLEVVPQIHSHSSSGAHALAVTLTSGLPLDSSAQLWRRSVLSSFMRYHTISIFLSGLCIQSCNFWAGRGKREEDAGGGVGGRAIFGFFFHQADCNQASYESQLFGDRIN